MVLTFLKNTKLSVQFSTPDLTSLMDLKTFAKTHEWHPQSTFIYPKGEPYAEERLILVDLWNSLTHQIFSYLDKKKMIFFVLG